MKTKYSLSLLSGLLLLTSCEEGFYFGTDQGAGTFSKDALMMDIRDDAETVHNAPSRAGDDELADFKIMFFKNNADAPEQSFRYADMPDVIVLPVGLYSVTATKGTDVEADWESPYFLGQSNAFQIKKDSITSDVDPIICRMQNVKVTVEFDSLLTGAMSTDSYVEVKVGDNAGLKFDKSKEGVAGHFKHTDGVSLVATFNGIVEEAATVETKSFEQVQKGHHYKIKFKLHSQNADNSGQAGAEVKVDATVNVTDLDYNVTVGEDIDLGDDERPTEGNDTPDEPTPPVQDDVPPTIEALPQTNPGIPEIEFGKVNDIVDGMNCVLMIRSTADGGFTKFECKIDSETLDVTEVGLSNPLDLINPGSNEDALVNLGLLQAGQKVAGTKEVRFDLTSFMPLITMLGPGTHNFILTIGDANGETTKTLTLKSN